MGDWAKHEMDRTSLPQKCYIFAGTTLDEQKEKILSMFEKINFHKHDVYERYIVSDEEKEYLIIFQVYGAPLITDITHILNDGGVEIIIFIGAAFGIHESLRIGNFVIPDQIQALDGLLKMNFNVDYAYPDRGLNNTIKAIMQKKGEKYFEGKTVSVPSTFSQPDKSRHDNDVMALEIEFSSVCYFANAFNIACAGVLVISDTANHDLLDEQKLRHENILKAFELIKNELK